MYQLEATNLGLVTARLKMVSAELKHKFADTAIRKAAPVIVREIIPMVPFNPKRKNGKPHLRATIITKFASDQRGTIAIIGPESRQAPHGRIVEDGTRPRSTNSKPVYRTFRVNGKRVRKSTGSKKRWKRRIQLNRGVMPAFKYLSGGLSKGSREAVKVMSASILHDLESLR